MPPSTSGKAAATSPTPRGSFGESGTTSVTVTEMCGRATPSGAAAAAAAFSWVSSCAARPVSAWLTIGLAADAVSTSGVAERMIAP